MNDDDELIEIVDEHDAVLDVVPRGVSENRNAIKRNAIIFVFNSKSQVLVQLRANTKKHYPGLLDASAGGAIGAGEDVSVAAQRELLEEAGLTCQLQFVDKFFNTFPDETGTIIRKRWTNLYIGRCDDQPTANHEVAAIEWWKIDKLLAALKAHPEKFVPSFNVEFEIALKAFQV